MDDLPDDANSWQEAILHNADDARQGLRLLNERDHASYICVARQLMQDADTTVRHEALLTWAFYGDPNDAEVEVVAIDALQIPELRNAALVALKQAGTPAAFPFLLSYASQGFEYALHAAAWQARTPQQRQQVLELARKQLFFKSARVRTMAVRVIRRLSSPEREEQLLLKAARRHLDEMVIYALRWASNDVLPALREMLAEIGPGYAESKDLAEAIATIESRERSAGS
jgi:hypothetical protein